MIKLMSAIPNSVLFPGEGFEVLVSAIAETEVIDLLKVNSWESCVGHDSTAKLFSEKLLLNIGANRKNVELSVGDVLVVGMFTPPRRLNEGEVWTEGEILAMPINWVKVAKFPKGILVAPSAAAIA